MLGDLLEAFANLSNNMQIFIILFIGMLLAKFFKKELLDTIFTVLGYIFFYIVAYEKAGTRGIGAVLCLTAIIMPIIWFFKGNLSRKAIVIFVLLFLVSLGLMGVLL
jgi:hypothetical protein